MSYLKSIEENYEKGIIGSKERQKLRDEYYRLSSGEKKSLDRENMTDVKLDKENMDDESRKTAEHDKEPLRDSNEDLAYSNHLKEVARIRKKYTTEMTDRELNLYSMWHTNESYKSLKVIKAWVTFFGVLQILGLIAFIIYFFQIIIN